MKESWRVAHLAGCLILSFPLLAQEEIAVAADGFPAEPAGKIDLAAADVPDLLTKELPAEPAGKIDLAAADVPDLSTEGSGSSAKDSRVTLAHEVSGGTEGVVNNRSGFRVEYSKLFWNRFFVQLDSKLNTYWKNDHRADAEDKTVRFQTNTPEAFLQYSGGRTSIKIGQQRLIWGESEAGAITDEVSPRDFSEVFFIRLEESRRGQLMAVLDHFAPSGDWTAFFVPDAKFNRYSEPGTAYYIDPFAGGAEIRNDPFRERSYEYGISWKKTLNQSDISFMAADLIDNDYALRQAGVTGGGQLLISRLQQRFTMVGGTFNYARGKYLLKGEIAYKTPKAFNDASFQITKRDVLDSALGLTYSLGQSNTIGLEIVNRHVRDWSNELAGIPQNTNSLVLNANLFFFSEDLLVNWLMIYDRPYTGFTSSLRTSYEWTDNLTTSADFHLVDVPSSQSALYPFRDQDQIVFRIQYQF